MLALFIGLALRQSIVPAAALLLESGDRLLAEGGGFILLE